MFIGIGLTIVKRAGTGGSGLNAPVLAVDSPLTNPPTFTATIDLPLVGDIIRLQISPDSGFVTITEEATNTLDGAEVADGEALFAVAALSGGTYYSRVRQERGGVSAWSNTETFIIVGNAIQIEDSTGSILLEDGSGVILLESA